MRNAHPGARVPDLSLRLLAREDLEPLACHVPEAPGRTHEDDWLEQERRTLSVLVAWSGARPVGCGVIHWPGPLSTSVARDLAKVPEIHRLWVEEPLRARGIGRRLLRALEALARRRGLGQVGLGVGLENVRARALYERVGYVDAGLASYDDVWFYVDGAGKRIEVRDRCHFLLKPLDAPPLVLFDIDGTLLRSQGSGRAAMLDAGVEMFGESFAFGDVDLRGRLDPLIWQDLARANEIDAAHAREAEFRARYRVRLEQRLAVRDCAQALPGTLALVARLARRGDLALGILSGNYPETGRLKLAAVGLDPDTFEICAWGDDAPTRPDLIPIALARYAEQVGASLPTAAVLVIGDTPHDVTCARAHGCRALAVATGGYAADELARCGADRVLASLADVDAVERWILESGSTRRSAEA
jgi:phosphoglycolate phosphatase